MISWNIVISGNDYLISVEPGANDKHAVRVNGRVAAQAIAATDNDRRLVIAGVPYVIVRAEDSFALYPEESQQERSPIPRILRWAAIVAAALLLLWGLRIWNYNREAEDRVKALLFEIHDGGETVRALTLWAGRRNLDAQEFSWVSNNFNRWRQDRGLYKKQLFGYRITRSQRVRGQATPTAVVTVTLEDATEFRVRVPKGRPMAAEP